MRAPGLLALACLCMAGACHDHGLDVHPEGVTPSPGALTPLEQRDTRRDDTAEHAPLDLACWPAGLPPPSHPPDAVAKVCGTPRPPPGKPAFGPPPEQNQRVPGPLPPGVGPDIWELLGRTYDDDESRTLEPLEQDQLATDLQTRCMARQDRFLARFDLDGNEGMSAEELASAAQHLDAEEQEHHHQDLARYDSNRDGTLDCAEFAALMERRHADQQTRLDQGQVRFDANHSGVLEADERKALRRFTKEQIRSGLLPGEDPAEQSRP